MSRDILVFGSVVDPFPVWRDALAAHLQEVDILEPEAVDDPQAVKYALVWKPPADFFAAYPNLELIINLGAGVDALVSRTDLPDVPITRISDPEMATMMAGYVQFSVLRYARDIPQFEKAQRSGQWHYLHPRDAGDIKVGVLGLGELGGCAARELARLGFDVRGWSRSEKKIDGVKTFNGMAALDGFLADSEISVVMLPATPETRQLLDANRLAQLPKGARLINVSRGEIIVEAALVEALRSGHIGGATLDVFEVEPLPESSPLWSMENVLITPHIASVAIPRSAARQIAENINRLRAGGSVRHRVDPARGY
ncbi:2-hydroxyacid dehydrogenase [Roseibium marinum]|uniref:Glyoxylate/hydroxypyruvate reductase A n=1 Tax=Roseibium marinum TaxID=281252 RepID=A0A2S3UT89_9HYPH|nr:glyoxylate/hydroxypyruvate reductase A [Roseibium marinum]POF30931.1 glyoxylate/hydroxypyruvate reductase A [Roseibium marinum]